jgi:hypothetical protein
MRELYNLYSRNQILYTLIYTLSPKPAYLNGLWLPGYVFQLLNAFIFSRRQFSLPTRVDQGRQPFHYRRLHWLFMSLLRIAENKITNTVDSKRIA